MQLSATVRVLCVACAFAIGLPAPFAHAFELFGIHLFGEKKEDLDSSGQPGLKYEVQFDVSPNNAVVEERLKNASTLNNLVKRKPRDSAGLKARAEADLPRLIAALYSEGYYGGTAEISVAGRPVSAIEPGSELAPAGRTIPVVIKVRTGPPFVFGRVQIIQPARNEKAPTSDPRAYGIVPGEPALSGTVLEAEEQLVKAWRENGYALADVGDRNVMADHPSRTLNVTLTVDPGLRASFGTVSVEGTDRMDPAFVARQTGIVPGTRYSPFVMEDARARLRRLDVFESVRIDEGESLAKGDRLPVAVAVSERKRRVIGANAGWSSVDGGEVEAYWAHRNLFGRAERLRIEGAVAQFGGGPFDELKYRAGISFAKPGILDVDTDLFADQVFLRERPDAYESKSATTRVGLTRRFTRDHIRIGCR